MSKTLRVGDCVYQSRRLAARKMHGSWCRPVQDGNGQVTSYDPVDVLTGQMYEDMTDYGSYSGSLPDGEREVLEFMARCGIRGELLNEVRGGLEKGLRVYGPFHPGEEERNLMDDALNEIRDFIVYLSMQASVRVDAASQAQISRLVRGAYELWDVTKRAKLAMEHGR